MTCNPSHSKPSCCLRRKRPPISKLFSPNDNYPLADLPNLPNPVGNIGRVLYPNNRRWWPDSMRFNNQPFSFLKQEVVDSFTHQTNLIQKFL
jgi:hypothetical protein